MAIERSGFGGVKPLDVNQGLRSKSVDSGFTTGSSKSINDTGANNASSITKNVPISAITSGNSNFQIAVNNMTPRIGLPGTYNVIGNQVASNPSLQK